MNTTIMKELETILANDNKISGDLGNKFIEKVANILDTHIETTSSMIEVITVHSKAIKDLENNLNSFVSRVYNTTDDFTEWEIETIESAFEGMDSDDLKKIKINKDYIYDMLYIMIEDYEEQVIKSDLLFNKIKYPNSIMNATFNRLLDKAIKEMKRIEDEVDSYIDVRNENEAVIKYAEERMKKIERLALEDPAKSAQHYLESFLNYNKGILFGKKYAIVDGNFCTVYDDMIEDAFRMSTIIEVNRKMKLGIIECLSDKFKYSITEDSIEEECIVA